VEVFTAEMPGGALEASELQGTLEATQAPQLNIAVDDPDLKVWWWGSVGLPVCLQHTQPDPRGREWCHMLL
jgi:hypothetical protein